MEEQDTSSKVPVVALEWKFDIYHMGSIYDSLINKLKKSQVKTYDFEVTQLVMILPDTGAGNEWVELFARRSYKGIQYSLVIGVRRTTEYGRKINYTISTGSGSTEEFGSFNTVNTGYTNNNIGPYGDMWFHEKLNSFSLGFEFQEMCAQIIANQVHKSFLHTIDTSGPEIEFRQKLKSLGYKPRSGYPYRFSKFYFPEKQIRRK